MNGFALNIDDSFLKTLAEVDKQMSSLMKKKTKFSKGIVEAFQEISKSGVEPFVAKLKQTQDALKAISNVPIQGKASAKLKKLQTDASLCADNVNKLILAMQGLTTSADTQREWKAFDNVQRVNKLYSERIHYMQQLESIVRKGMTSELVNTSAVTSQISTLQTKLQSIEIEIGKYNSNVKNLSKATINALTKGEADFTLAEEKELKKRLEAKRKTSEEILKLENKLQKVVDKKNKLVNTTAYQSGDANAVRSYNDLIAREQDLQNKIITMRNNLGALLAEIERKYAAEGAAKEVAEIQAAEDKKLQIAKDRMAKQLAESKKYGNISSASAMRLLGFSGNATNVAQEQAAIDKLKQARNQLNKTDANYQQTLDALNKKIAEHEHNIKMATDATYRKAQADKATMQQNTTYQGAMAYSRQTKTIQEQIQAIEYLKQARDKLDKTTMSQRDYEESVKRLNKEIRRQQEKVDRLRDKQGALGKSHRNLMDTAGQLQRKLALIFSVSQILGYMDKLVKVRKEFELQRKSLEVLLQSKNQADKLWQQTMDLAVKSPFRVKELVTYTKQLAAYRIESDQLFDTTKRLSDVSAGLGVDMQRLILAYGQIRAAGFLRGTELRQLTEAGLPMLDELSKYLTEIEGRTIRAGDVFEMISKRMVSFKDVQEVFKRMTNEGGVFFNMQEEQAKTLAGSISNLHDSIDLMLNDIGRANDETLKGSIAFARSLVSNWREVQAAMEFILVSSSPFLLFWGLAKVASSSFAKSLLVLAGHSKLAMKVLTAINPALSEYTAKATVAGAATKILRTALGGLTTLGIGFAIYYVSDAILSLYLSATKASRIAEELKKNLNNIIKDDVTNLEKQVNGFKDLSTRLGEANEGSQERREIISALNSQYGEYLDFVVNETTSMDELAKSYDRVVDRMKERAALASFEKGFQAINDSYGKQLEDATEDFYSIFRGASIRKEIDGIVGFTNIVPTKKEVDDIFNLIQQKIREKNIEEIDSLEEQRSLLDEIIKGYYGETFSLSQMPVTTVDLIDIFVKRKKDELRLQEQINQEYKKTLQSQEANLAFEQLQNEYALKQKEIRAAEGLSQFEVNKQLKNLKTQFELDKIELKFRFGEISQNEMIDAKNKIWKWASETVMAVNEQIERELSGKFSEEEYSQILISQEEYEKGMSTILKNTIENYELHNKLLMDEISLKDAGKQFDEEKIKKYERLLELDKFRAKALGIELDLIQKIDQESVNSINSKLEKDFQISLEDSYKSVLQLREETNGELKQAIALQEALNLQASRGVEISQATLDEIDNKVSQLTLKSKLLGTPEEEKKNRTTTNSLYDERIKVIDDMNKKYKELNKTLEKSEALQGAFDAYIDAFATAYEGISWVPDNVRSMSPQEFASKVLNFPDENALVAFLERLSKEPMKTFEKIKVELAKGEYVYDMKVRVKSEDDKELLEQIEDMFSGYEMSIELQKMNIPPDLAKQLFNIDSLSLPELRDKVISMESKFIGTDMEDEYREFLKKIDDMEEKAQLERLKKYSKYLVKAQSERVKIKLEEMRQLAEIEKEDRFTSEQKSSIKRQIRIETQESLDKQAWEDFKNSEMYTQMFEDLEYLGEQAITNLRHKLELLKSSLSDLPASDVKEIMTQIKKLEELEIKYNPFSSMRDAIKEVDDLRKNGKTEEMLQMEMQAAQANIESYTNEKEAIAQIIEALHNKNDANLLSNDIANEYRHLLMLSKDDLEAMSNSLDKKIQKEEESAKNAGIDLAKYTKARKATQGFVDNITAWGEAISGVLGGVDSILDAFGVAEDDSSRLFVQSAQQIADMVVQTVILTASLYAMGVAANNALGIIGWIATGLQAVGMLFAGIFAAGDKKKERQIKREQELVDKLQKAYEKLGEEIENAYKIDTFEAAIDQSQKNLKQQIAATERMIALEEDKKKTDKDKIKEWKDEIEEMREMLDELEEERIQGLGGFGNKEAYKSATEDFVNAWLDAYKETGDGLSGLEEQFKEFFENMVKNQLMMRGVDKFLDPLYKQFDEMFSENSDLGGKVSKGEIEAIKNMWATISPELSTFMESLIESLGIASDLSSSTNDLSGLQRGIQGVTEETAQIIEAYLNSIRFFVAEQTTYLSQIASSFGNTEMENPMVSELKTQTEMIRAIRDMFSSVIRNGHPTFGGAFIKVAL